MKELATWLANNQTEEELGRAIIARLNQWHNNPINIQPLNIVSPSVAATIKQQDAIGWYQFLLGRTSYKFAETQDAYFKFLKKITQDYDGHKP